MACYGDRKSIWLVDPKIVDDFGNKAIVGYENVREYTDVLCVPAYSEQDIAIYGSEIASIMKFQCEYDIDVAIDGGTGIYLEKPNPQDDGLYHEPTYISKPLLGFNDTRLFDGEKQRY